MQGIVDRIEGDIVVIEIEEKITNVNKDKVEGIVSEGDVVDIIYKDGKIIKVKKNNEKTKSRQDYISNLIKDMWQ